MTDTKTEHTYAVSAEDKEIIDWINDETKVSTAPAEREEVSIDWIKTDSDVSEAHKAEESDTLIDWINTDSNVSEAPKAEEDEVSIDWIDTDSDVLEASQTETAEIVGAEEDTSAKAEEPLYTEAEANAFASFNLVENAKLAEDARAKAEAEAEAELVDIYHNALARTGNNGMYFEDALNEVLDELVIDDPRIKRETTFNKVMDMRIQDQIPDIHEAAIIKTADGMTYEEALNAVLDELVAVDPRTRRETISSRIMDMVAKENSRIAANRTISEESAKALAATRKESKLIRESLAFEREAEELKEILEIVDNLRKGQKTNGIKDDQIIDYAVHLYLLGDNVKVEGYKEMNDEQKKKVHDALAARVANFEEKEAIKNMEKAEAKESSSLLSKVVETVKKHKDVVIVACGVAVATLAAVSFLSPTGLLGLPVVALGPTSTKAVLAIAAFTLAAEHVLKAGLRIINKLSDDLAKNAIEKEKALKAGREVLAKAKEKTAEKEVGKTAAPEKSVPVTRTVNVREALLADRLSQKVNG